MTARGWWGEAALLLAFGCSDVETTCKRGDSFGPNTDTAVIQVPDLVGEVILSADQTSFSTSFEAALDKPPEVWADERHRPILSVQLTLEYPDSQPAGAELPEVTAVLEPRGGHTSPTAAAQATTTLGGPRTGFGLGVAPFVNCPDSASEDCCPSGASRCAGGVELRLSRAADLFPRVRIRYTATMYGNLYSCEGDPAAARWTFEEVGK